jgi:hypothetical protein
MEYGKKAQAHPAQVAMRGPKTLRAIRNTGTQVNDENMLFNVKSTSADATV